MEDCAKKFDLARLASRTEAILAHSWAAKRSIAVIGVGSGGSLVAWWLAATGVGRITLVDPDRLEPENLWRHLCTLDHLGRPKVEAVADHISRVNPWCECKPLIADVEAQEALVRKALETAGCEILVVATDTATSGRASNRIALALGIPAVYAACFEEAAAGEVLVTRPGGACHGCISAAVSAEQPENDHETQVDYGSAQTEAGGSGEDGRPTPGLGMSVALVANLQAHAALWLLREAVGEPFPLKGNYFLVGSRAVPGITPHPFAFRQWFVTRRSDCIACAVSCDGARLAGRGRELLAGLDCPTDGEDGIVILNGNEAS